MREEKVKGVVISNDLVTITNLKENKLNAIVDSDGLKSGVNKLLSNPAGLKLMERLLGKNRFKENL